MRAKLKSVWVRKLIGKLGVPYNRRLRVRGSPHPLNYDADLSLPAADSNAFRIHSVNAASTVNCFPLSAEFIFNRNGAAVLAQFIDRKG
jgi:hypothetical protein